MKSQIQIKLIFLFFFVSLMLMSGIFLKKEKKTAEFIQKKITVTGYVEIHHPYCGGASPSPEMEMGYFTPYQNSDFYVVIKEDSSRTPIAKFTTNEKGYFEVSLIPNKYCIFGSNKMVTFEEFCEQNVGNNGNNVNMGVPCMEEWYNSPDFVLNAKNDTTIRIYFYTSCFVGMNPCLMYTGPLPN